MPFVKGSPGLRYNTESCHCAPCDSNFTPTSRLCIIAERAGLVNPVLLQQLLIPGTTVQRVSKAQELPGEAEEQSVNNNKQVGKRRTTMLCSSFRIIVDELIIHYLSYIEYYRHVILL